jgi:hypothetical protein
MGGITHGMLEGLADEGLDELGVAHRGCGSDNGANVFGVSSIPDHARSKVVCGL